jgi:transcription termination/antitermination protein NusA
VMAELHGEKIDIVDFSEDPAEFVANALSPARVTRVDVVDPAAMEARVVVPDYQLSLAIGKEGQNARLAARLTGWRIDIRSDAAAEAAPAAETPAAVAAPGAASGAGAAPQAPGGAPPQGSSPASGTGVTSRGPATREAQVPRQGREVASS